MTPLRSGFHFLLHFSASPSLLSHSVLPGKPCHRTKLLQDAGVGAGSTTSGPCHVLAWWTGEIFPPLGCPGAGGEPSLPGALLVAPCLLPLCCSQTCNWAGGASSAGWAVAGASCFLGKRGFCGRLCYRGIEDFSLCAFSFEVYTLVAAIFLDVLVTQMRIVFNLIFIRELYHVVLASPQEGLETPCRRDNTSYLRVNTNSPQM